MRKGSLILVLGGLLVALTIPTIARADGSVDFFAGQRELDKDFGGGKNIEQQDAIALFTDFAGDKWPVRIAFNVISGRKDTTDELQIHLDGSTGEIDAGARWYPMKDARWMPHLGAGLGLMSGKVTTSGTGVDDVSFNESKVGWWADGGIGYRFGSHFKLGARVHYAVARINPKGDTLKSVNAAGLTYGVSAGFAW
jgi:hypothetical protein